MSAVGAVEKFNNSSADSYLSSSSLNQRETTYLSSALSFTVGRSAHSDIELKGGRAA